MITMSHILVLWIGLLIVMLVALAITTADLEARIRKMEKQKHYTPADYAEWQEATQKLKDAQAVLRAMNIAAREGRCSEKSVELARAMVKTAQLKMEYLGRKP